MRLAWGGQIYARRSCSTWPALVKGTVDHFPEACAKFAFLEHHFKNVCQRYCFSEIRTPIIENAELFQRLGNETDIVHKEMFYLKNSEEVLRPENTASVMRALSTNTGIKPSNRLYYCGPMFRREQPQKGRWRQFQQFGVEAIGIQERGPESDVEVITLAVQCLKHVGLLDNTKLLLNTLGDEESRKAYQQVLADYFQPISHLLSENSQARLARGAVLRILDSKDPVDLPHLENAPNIFQSLKPTCKERFDAVKGGLKALGIKYEVCPLLVRGLDYYSHTIFEFVDAEHNGRQNTLLAGGRYDGFLTLLNSPTPAVGWAAGLDRLGMLLQDSQRLAKPPLVHIIAMSPKCLEAAMRIAAEIRINLPLRVRIQQGSVRAMVGLANSAGASACVIIGEEEISAQMVGVRYMNELKQIKVPDAELLNVLRTTLKSHAQPKS